MILHSKQTTTPTVQPFSTWHKRPCLSLLPTKSSLLHFDSDFKKLFSCEIHSFYFFPCCCVWTFPQSWFPSSLLWVFWRLSLSFCYASSVSSTRFLPSLRPLATMSTLRHRLRQPLLLRLQSPAQMSPARLHRTAHRHGDFVRWAVTWV